MPHSPVKNCNECPVLNHGCSCYGSQCNHPDATPELQELLADGPLHEGVPTLCPMRRHYVLTVQLDPEAKEV